MGVRARILAVALLVAISPGCSGSQPAAPGNGTLVSQNAVTPPPAPEGGSGSESCDATAAQALVGQVAGPDVIDAAKEKARASIVRVLKLGEGATWDFVSGRVNIQLDASGRIAGIRCG